ncbi:MAG: Spy/CpxP family protein refolding chaperone [Bryobacteraceae bacterium]
MMRFILCIAVFAASLAAQPGPGRGFGPGMGDPSALKEFLGLTDAQVTQLRQLQRERMETTRPLMRQMAEQRKRLREAMDGPAPDATAVGNLVLEGNQLRRQLQQTSTQFRERARGVLTADQTAKLAELEKAAALRPAIGQAAMLNLIEGPGMGRGRTMMMGPRPMEGQDRPMQRMRRGQ